MGLRAIEHSLNIVRNVNFEKTHLTCLWLIVELAEQDSKPGRGKRVDRM